MSFTATVVSSGPFPSRAAEGEHGEVQSYVNTAGSIGGTFTSRFLKYVDRVEGAGILSRSVSGKTATIVTDANASGSVTLYGRT